MMTIERQQANEIVGNWLVDKRTERGLSRKAFATYCTELGVDGIGFESIRGWEQGRSMPTFGLVASLLRALEPDVAVRRQILAARLYITEPMFAELVNGSPVDAS